MRKKLTITIDEDVYDGLYTASVYQRGQDVWARSS